MKTGSYNPTDTPTREAEDPWYFVSYLCKQRINDEEGVRG